MTLAVAFLGPTGTYTHQAALEIFSSSETTSFVPVTSISDVFKSIINGDTSMGVVPVENSTFGIVLETYDVLRDPSLADSITICGEHTLSITHSLIGRKGTSIKDVREVWSHPQALGQCANWLSSHLPHATQYTTSSTGAAVDKVLSAPDEEAGQIAAIGSSTCVSLHRELIEVLEEGIQDQQGNRTRFLVLASKSLTPIPIPTHSSNPRVLVQFTPRVPDASSSPPSSLRLDWFSTFPLGAIIRIDRRPALETIPFHDSLLIELDAAELLRASAGEGVGNSTREEELDKQLERILGEARRYGDAHILGQW